MKKIIISLFSLLCVLSTSHAKDVGVPAQCEDVMLQAFYWDSYRLDKYGKTIWINLLKDTAAINANFDLVWLPPSAKGGGVGYYHQCLSDQNSDWGQKMNLQKLIQALRAGGTKVIADVVINHRGNKSSWCDFYEDDFTFLYGGKFQLTEEHICSGDECFTDASSSCKGGTLRGAADTGTNDSGARDLDHTSAYVQSWAKAYLKWLKGNMKYEGFRYDMTRGYNGKYLSMYNQAAQPYISVSEFWEGIGQQVNHLKAAEYNTMIFDFPLKYTLGDAIVKGSYGLLKNPANSLRGKGYAKYAVTFIDNHDTFERSDSQGNQFGGYNVDLGTDKVKAQILQANAYILMMPGIPCVFWPHWKSYQKEINEMIAIRKKAGIHSESLVTDEITGTLKYSATIHGKNGKVILRLGNNRETSAPAGYYMAAIGNHYSIYLEEGMAIDEVPVPANAPQKFIKDGQMYIQRDGKVYDMTGRLME